MLLRHDSDGKPLTFPNFRRQTLFQDKVPDLFRPAEAAAHQDQFLEKGKPLDRQSADVEFLDYQQPARGEDPCQLTNHLPLAREMMQGIDYHDPLEDIIWEREKGHIGLDRMESALFPGLTQHA
nr:hypothetical protein [Desulfuromonas sp. DDH964]